MGLLTLAFVLLVLVGRAQVAKGANAHVANGSVLLVFATLIGVVVLSLVGALNFW